MIKYTKDNPAGSEVLQTLRNENFYKIMFENRMSQTIIKHIFILLDLKLSSLSDDHNCVKLTRDDDDTKGYVNASYIHVS